MTIAFLMSFRNSGADQVFKPIIRGLTARGHEIFPIYPDMPFPQERFNIVHHSWLGVPHGESLLSAARTCNIWSVPLGKVNSYMRQINELGFDNLVVDDVMTLQILGQCDFTAVDLIPMVMDPLPPLEFHPADPIVLGIMGNSYDSKRFDIVHRAFKGLKGPKEFKLYAATFPAERRLFVMDPIKDYYKHISIHIHSSFMDTNSLPAMEALAQGIPVIATRSHGLERVLKPGINGEWFDGSAEDLRAKILKMSDSLHQYFEKAHQTIFPSVTESTDLYEQMFERLV
jgi:hypothetical protein